MNNFIFQNATKSISERMRKEYLSCLTKDAGTILLAYGGGSIKRNGVYDEICAILKDAGKNIVEFSGIMSNPTYEKGPGGSEACPGEPRRHMILRWAAAAPWTAARPCPSASQYDGDIWEDFWARQGVIDFEPLPLG